MLQLQVTWTQILVICGGLGTISGGIAAICKFNSWWKKKKNELASIANARAEMQPMLKEILERLDAMQKSIQQLDLQISTIQHEKMVDAYVNYGVKKKPIDIQKRGSLEQMYKQYSGKHNHIPSDFVEKIYSAPVEGETDD